MEKVYLLEHIYVKDEQEEIKFIGIFSSVQQAQQAIEELKYKSGFKNYPIDCFKIGECIVDNYGWKDGFISWEDA